MALTNQTQSCLNIAIGYWPPFVEVTNNEPPYEIEGPFADLLLVMLKKIGVCYKWIRSSDLDYGIELPNGTWTGTLGMLHRNEADMSAVMFMMSESRAKILDFSEYILMSDQTISYSRPSLELDISGVIKPYTHEVWLSIFLGLLVTLVVVSIFNKAEAVLMSSKRRPRIGDENEAVAPITKYQESSIWVFCALIMQSVPWQPKGETVRLVAGTWILVTFIFSSVYRSNLVAMLVSPTLRLPFNSFEELAQTDSKIYIIEDSRFADAIQKAEPGSVLWNAKHNFFNDIGLTEGIDGYYAKKWGISTSRQTLETSASTFFADHGYCGLYVMSDGMFKATTIGFAFPKKSALKPKIDTMLRNLREFGIVDRFQKSVLLPNATKCLKPHSSNSGGRNQSLALRELYSAFLILTAGILISSFVLAAECLANKLSKPRKLAKLSQVVEEEIKEPWTIRIFKNLKATI